MDMTEIKNGIIYCRVSSFEQISGTSLESQEKICKEYADKLNINILNIFIEKGESAKTTDRTEFNKAIQFCSLKKNRVGYFIVYKLDRFARNQNDHAIISHLLNKYGVKLRSVTEPIDDTPTGKLMEGVLSSFAEFDNNIRKERSVNGMRERMKQGIWVWKAPLGYYRIGKGKGINISPDPKFAPYIQLAFEEYSKGIHTFESLANFLNKRGFVTNFNKQAIPQLMEKIIKNKLYCGIVSVPKWNIEVKGTFESIITEELFYKCQVGKKKKNAHLEKNTNFPLKKLVVCEHCGTPLTGSCSTNRHGHKYPYYHHQKQNCLYASYWSKNEFESKFLELLGDINPNPTFLKLFREVVLDIYNTNFTKISESNQTVRKEIENLELRKQKVFDNHQSGIYTDQEFFYEKERLNRLIAEKKLLLQDEKQDDFNIKEALDFCIGFIENTPKTWLDLENDFEKRLRFQKSIFEDKLEFGKNGFGTPKLSPIYMLNREFLKDKSSLVSLLEMRPRYSLPCKAHFDSF